MANLRGAPSWVQVQPTDFSGALLKGFQTGMSLADMQNRVAESNAERAQAAQRQAEAAALSEWETQQRMELEREKLAQQAMSDRAQQAALDQWRQGQLENQALANAIDQAQQEETARRNAALEARGNLPTEWNRDPTKAYVTTGGAYVAPGETQNQTPQQEARQKGLLQEQKFAWDELNKAREKLTDPLIEKSGGMPQLMSDIGALQNQYSTVMGNLTNTPAASTVTPSSTNRLERLSGVNPAAKVLDRATAIQLLQQAGGDTNKARQLAKQLGYTF